VIECSNSEFSDTVLSPDSEDPLLIARRVQTQAVLRLGPCSTCRQAAAGSSGIVEMCSAQVVDFDMGIFAKHCKNTKHFAYFARESNGSRA
jgi:hypothetical protein